MLKDRQPQGGRQTMGEKREMRLLRLTHFPQGTSCMILLPAAIMKCRSFLTARQEVTWKMRSPADSDAQRCRPTFGSALVDEAGTWTSGRSFRLGATRQGCRGACKGSRDARVRGPATAMNGRFNSPLGPGSQSMLRSRTAPDCRSPLTEDVETPHRGEVNL
jgi:hypothetical protein